MDTHNKLRKNSDCKKKKVLRKAKNISKLKRKTQKVVKFFVNKTYKTV